MMSRQVLIAVSLFCAATADLGLPAHGAGAVRPSFLDLAFIMLCQICGPAATVFWAGLAGLLGDVVCLRPLGSGVLLCATLALLWTVVREEIPLRSFTSRVLVSLGLLVLLNGIRIGGEHLLSHPLSLQEVQIASARVALTFLISVLAWLAGGARLAGAR